MSFAKEMLRMVSVGSLSKAGRRRWPRRVESPLQIQLPQQGHVDSSHTKTRSDIGDTVFLE